MPISFWIGNKPYHIHEMNEMNWLVGKLREQNYCEYMAVAFFFKIARGVIVDIDCAIFKQSEILLLEFKKISSPFNAPANGPWTLQSGAYSWENVYSQLNKYLSILSSFVRTNQRGININIARYVVIDESIPNGSVIDWPTLVIGMDTLPQRIFQSTGIIILQQKQIEQWLSQLGLTQMSLDPAGKLIIPANRQPDTWLEYDDIASLIKGYAEIHTGKFVERPECGTIINNLVNNFILIKGVPGAGKSALSAFLAANPAKLNNGKIFYYPFSDTAKYRRLQSTETFKRYLLGWFSREMYIEDWTNANANLLDSRINEAMELAFRWAATHNQRVCFIIDGLEEASQPLRHLAEWFQSLPMNDKVTFILSADQNIQLPESAATVNLNLGKEESLAIAKKAITKWTSSIAEKLTEHFKTEDNRNPLLIEALAEEINKNGSCDYKNLRGIKSYFKRRMDVLDEHTRDVMGTLAWAQDDITAEILGGILNLNRGDLNPCLPEDNFNKRFLRRIDGKFDFVHRAWKDEAKNFFDRFPELISNWCLKALAQQEENEYALRHAIKHLCDAQNYAKILELLTSFDFLMRKCRQEMLEGVLADYRLASKTESIKPQLREWTIFFDKHSNILRRGNERWPSYKILFQLAIDYDGDASIKKAAEEYLNSGKVDWFWLRGEKAEVPELQYAAKSVARVFEGHKTPVSFIDVVDNILLSSSSDAEHIIWDVSTGQIWRRNDGLFILTDGRRILDYPGALRDGLLKHAIEKNGFYLGENPADIRDFKRLGKSIFIVEGKNGYYIYNTDNSVRINLTTLGFYGEWLLKLHYIESKKVIVSWQNPSDGIIAWNTDGEELARGHLPEGQPLQLQMIYAAEADSIFAWSNGGIYRWNLQDLKTMQWQLFARVQPINCLYIPGKGLLSVWDKMGSCDREAALWDINSGKCIKKYDTFGCYPNGLIHIPEFNMVGGWAFCEGYVNSGFQFADMESGECVASCLFNSGVFCKEVEYKNLAGESAVGLLTYGGKDDAELPPTRNIYLWDIKSLLAYYVVPDKKTQKEATHATVKSIEQTPASVDAPVVCQESIKQGDSAEPIAGEVSVRDVGTIVFFKWGGIGIRRPRQELILLKESIPDYPKDTTEYGAFSPYDNRLLTRFDNKVELWDIASYKLLDEIKIYYSATMMSEAPNRRHVYCLGNAVIRVDRDKIVPLYHHTLLNEFLTADSISTDGTIADTDMGLRLRLYKGRTPENSWRNFFYASQK